MQFLHPAFLWALAVLVVPVLIHLFQLRRFKRIDFTHVRLLAEVSRQTRARRRVQHWLVLLARCVALAALVFAFAQPYLPGEHGETRAGQRAISLFIDDSHSMDGANARGRLLDQARQGAQDAVMAHAQTDRFQVVTNRLAAREQRLVGRDEALQAASQAEASPFVRPLSQVLIRQREALAASDAPVKRAILFTDLQQSITDVDQWMNDSTVPVSIVPLSPAETDNLSIDSIWFESPVRRRGQREALHARITNHGRTDLVGIPLRLRIDGTQRAMATISIGAGARIDTSLSYMNDRVGHHWGELEVEDQPVDFDNRFHLAYTTVNRLRVLLVGGADAQGDRAVRAVFAGDSIHTFSERGMAELDLALLPQQDLVVLNGPTDLPSGTAQALVDFVRSGGSLAFFPSSGGEPSRFTNFFSAFSMGAPALLDTGAVRVEGIDLEQPFYRDMFDRVPRNVDLPAASERWALRPPPGATTLLRTRDNAPFLATSTHGQGNAYFFAAPLKERSGNLTRHALFATSLLRMAELARPTGALYATIGAESLLPIDGVELPSETPPSLLGPGGMQAIPEVRRVSGSLSIVLHDAEAPPGAYALVSGLDTLRMLALNLARTESDLRHYTAQEMRGLLRERGLSSFRVVEGDGADLSLRLATLDEGQKLWKWFILLALLALLAETLLLRASR
jgi:hypothetical protein